MSSHSELTAAFESCRISAGNDVRLHISNVTNVYHSSDGAGLPEVKLRDPMDEPNNILPPRPVHMLERDGQREHIVKALLSSPDTRVAILGMGGIGKTTLAASIMWNSQIQLAYPHQYFVSFEGLSTPDLVYSSLTTIFEIPSDDRKSHSRILSWVVQYLGRKRTLICIDNFESFWEVPENRRAADDFLAHLSSVPTLAILVTLRGVQRPFKLPWLRLDPLTPLTQEASIELLDRIAQEDFSESDRRNIRDILDGVAGIPLAVTLVANLLGDGTESPQSLWSRWNAESTQAIAMDVEDRQYHLDVSLRLSVFGPRMSADSRAVLVAIAILPAGFLYEDAWLDQYQGLLPPTIHLRNCLRALQNTALCSIDRSSTPPRFQLLSPIRQFCVKTLPLGVDAVHKLIELYNRRLDRNCEYASSTEYAWFTNELTNITAILNFALSLPDVAKSLAYACSAYTRWMTYLGSPTTDIICKATDAQPEGSRDKAKCLQSHAEVLSLRGQKSEAMALLREALSIHRGVQDLAEEAWDLWSLGDIYTELRQLDNAEEAHSAALKLYREQGLRIEEANCLRSLAIVYDGMNRLSQAETSAKQSIELYLLTKDQLGEVNALNILGWVYRRQGKLEKALETSQKACQISKEIRYIIGQATAFRYLGLVHEAEGDTDQAASCFRESIRLFETCSDLVHAQLLREDLSKVLLKLDLVVTA